MTKVSHRRMMSSRKSCSTCRGISLQLIALLRKLEAAGHSLFLRVSRLHTVHAADRRLSSLADLHLVSLVGMPALKTTRLHIKVGVNMRGVFDAKRLLHLSGLGLDLLLLLLAVLLALVRQAEAGTRRHARSSLAVGASVAVAVRLGVA